MIHTGKDNLLFPGILKLFIVVLLILGMFGIVYLRSGVMKIEYTIGELEKTKMNYLKERKMLIAEKTSLLSFEKIEASLNSNQDFILPDRIMVIHVEKQEGASPYKTATVENKHIAEK